MMLGTVTGFGPRDTLMRTDVPSTTTVPGRRRLARHRSGSLSESTSTTCASRPAVVSSATASVSDCADDARNRHLGLPGRDVDRHDRLLLDLRSLRRALGEDEALLDVRVRDVADARNEIPIEDLVDRERPLDPHDVGHCDRLGVGESGAERCRRAGIRRRAAASTAPSPRSQGQSVRFLRRGSYGGWGGPPRRRATCVTPVSPSAARVPERMIVAASAVSSGTCPP